MVSLNIQIFDVDPDDFEIMRAESARGAEKVYPFDKLAVGQGFFFPLSEYQARNGADRTHTHLRGSLKACGRQYAPRKFSVRKHGHGYMVARIY